jgi:mono/diheme cytochrome c family protein
MSKERTWTARMRPAFVVLVGIAAIVAVGRAAASGKRGPARQGTEDAELVPKRADLMDRRHVGPLAWSNQQWAQRCKGVRTSFNPSRELSQDELTLRPSDPRWLDFVFWSFSNKINEHQFEAYGGTGWKGPKGGVLFHWAPGSHWERDTLHSFGFTIGHIVGEHRWTDVMFPDFFEKYGGVYGVNVKDRLAEIDAKSSAPWIAFLNYIGGADSPYYRYLLHADSSVDLERHLITLFAGQGVAFVYSYERYRQEMMMILTDCKAVSFFEMYDRFGSGFAAEGNWARQEMPPSALARMGYSSHLRYVPGLGAGGSGASARPMVETPVGVLGDLPKADRMKSGRGVYASQCVDCHGVAGDGAGFLAETFDVKPRDFRQGTYKLRSTVYGALPTIGDLERTIRRGIAGTTMPAWGQFLRPSEIEDVALYLIEFSPRFRAAWTTQAKQAVMPVSTVPAEVAELSSKPMGELDACAAQAGNRAGAFSCEGEKLAGVALCRQCHGDDMRGDGPTSQDLRDDWGNVSRPTDLTYKWLFKNGYEPADVYRSIFGGLNGTVMHSYATVASYGELAFSEQERWELVGYILSLSPSTRPTIQLKDFPAQRGSRIGSDGRVLALPPSQTR